MAQLICIYWRDIPAQVVGRQGRKTIKRELAPRFAEAIDCAALRAGKGSSDAYISEQINGHVEQFVHNRVAELESEFDEEWLEELVKAGGSVEEANKRNKRSDK